MKKSHEGDLLNLQKRIPVEILSQKRNHFTLTYETTSFLITPSLAMLAIDPIDSYRTETLNE